MMSIIRNVKIIAGDNARILVVPIVLSLVDSLLHMGMFSVMILTIIDLLNGAFTQQGLVMYVIVLVVLFIVRCVLYSINYTQTQYRGSDIACSLRLSLGDHIRNLNLGYFNKNSIGKLTGTLTTDIGDFEAILTHTLSNFFKVIFFTLLALFFAFVISIWFGLIILAIIAIAFPLLTIAGRVSSKSAVHMRRAVQEVVSRVVEYISGIKTFRLYNLSGAKFERLDASFQNLRKASIKTELSIMPFSISFSVVTSWIIPIALIVGAVFLQDGQLDSIRYIAVIMIALSISNMMTTLGSLYPEMRFLNTASDNILSVMKEKPFSFEEETAVLSSHDVVFQDVSFRYTEDVDVLKHLSFTATSGTKTALIGPSGSGKTTVLSLISRFWDVTDGSIRIGAGENAGDIRTIAPDGLAQHIAIVFQDVYLLNDTILNNIKVGKLDATVEEVEAAAKAACCHDFIMETPDGYQTMVGEGGSTLSGGEKQRISIARALIKDAPIVLLDETTSSLDADNEVEINRAFDRLMKDKTVIVIAHRLETIENSDNILVLNKGEIVEEGDHQTLLQNDGWYAAMHEEQRKARDWRVRN